MTRARILFAFLILFVFPAFAHADPSPGLPPPNPPIDRSTPRRSVDAYLQAAKTGDYTRAAYMLDLRAVPNREHATEGAHLARQLKLVLDAALWVDVDALSDEEVGTDAENTNITTLGTIRVGVVDQPIQLRRVSLAGNNPVWVFSARTVQAIPAMYDELGPGALGERMPKFLTRSAALGIELWQWLGLAIALAIAIVIGRSLSDIVLRGVLRLGIDVHELIQPQVLDRLRTPTRFAIGLVTFYVLGVALHLSPPARSIVSSAWRVLVAIVVALYAFRLIDLISSGIEMRAAANATTASTTNAARLRGVRTQVRLLRRVLNVVVALLGVGLVLMQFEGVRSFGVSLLAASGAAGLVLGLAAQRSLGSFFAGIQLSFTQPIRIGDTVVVEKEFGEVEEITLSYVAIKTWDQRRLIVPITYFLERPFENWTRGSEDLLGAAFVHADYTVPVAAVRAELERFVATQPLWDRKLVKLQVTDTTERAVILRALVSASNPDDLFSLRSIVREHMVSYLQELDGGKFIPKTRTSGEEMSRPDLA